MEALVALAIIAALSAALATTVTDHVRHRGALAQRRLALMLAQSALARFEGGDRADGGTWAAGSAQDQAYVWRITREPYDAGGTIGAGAGFGVAAPLEQVTVVVEDGAHRRLASLRSVRVSS